MAENIQQIYTDTYKYLQEKFKKTSFDVQKELLEELAPYVTDSVRRESAKALFMLGLDPKDKRDKEYINKLNNIGKKKSSFNTSPLKWVGGLLVIGAAGYGVHKGIDDYFKDKPVSEKEKWADTTNIINKTRIDTALNLSDSLRNVEEKKVQKPESIDESKLETLSNPDIEGFIEELVSDYPLDKDTLKKVVERVIESLHGLQVYGYEGENTYFMYVKNTETNKEVILSYYDDMDETFRLLSEVTGETFLFTENQEVNTEEATETQESNTEEEKEESKAEPEGVDMSVEIYKFQGQTLTEDEMNILMHQLVKKEDYSKLLGTNLMPIIFNIKDIAISKEGNTYFIFYKDVSNGINIPLGEWSFEKVQKALKEQFGAFEKGEGSVTPKSNKDASGNDVDALKSFQIPSNTSLDFSKLGALTELQFNENVTDQKRDQFLRYEYYLQKQLKSIAENFQKYEEKYSQKENFGNFKQEVQKEIDQIIEKSVQLQKDAIENPNSVSITVTGDPAAIWDLKMGAVANRVNLLSSDEKLAEMNE